MKLPRKIPWILPDKPHLDHVWFDHGDRRGITFQDRWKPNLQLGFQVTLTAGYYQWLFTPRHKLPVLLDIGHHLIHLLHWVPRTRIRDQELPAGSRSSLPLALTQSLPKNQAPKKTWMIHYFIPVEALDDRMSVLLVTKSVSFFFYILLFCICMYGTCGEQREKLNFVCVCMEHVWRSEKKQPVLSACEFEESNLIRSLCLVPSAFTCWAIGLFKKTIFCGSRLILNHCGHKLASNSWSSCLSSAGNNSTTY